MGKRSTNTTKSGKFMNPTDQARKIARKKELKKNKKQRLLVRTTVIKSRDPISVIADLERLDEIEYDVHTPPTLSDKVLKDKRRKLMETWARMCRLFANDDKDRLKDLKKMEIEYETKRSKMQKFYDAVKLAQEVSIDDIPLPSLPPGQSDSTLLTQLSFDPSEIMRPTSILSRKTPLGNIMPLDKSPPGVPPGLPPEWSEPEDDDSDSDSKVTRKGVKFGEQAVVDKFLKEVGFVDDREDSTKGDQETNRIPQFKPPNNIMPPMPHGAMMFRPPPPGVLPPGMIPPPGALPHLMRPPMMGGRMQGPPHGGGGVCIPPPTNMTGQAPTRPPIVNIPKPKKGITIESKPQLRNLSADLTKFVPTALRVRRNEATMERKVIKPGSKPGTSFGLTSSSPASSSSSFTPRSIQTSQQQNIPPSNKSNQATGQTRDDAYEAFMKEMQGIL